MTAVHARAVRIQRRFVWLTLALIAGSVGAIATTPAVLWPVAVPMLAIAWVIAIGMAVITPRDGSAPVDDIGAWFLLTLTMYSLLPPLVYIGLGGQYTVLNDARLLQANPSPADVSAVVRLYLCFVASFTGAYCLARTGHTRRASDGLMRPDRAFLISAATFFIVVRLFYLFLGAFFDLSSDTYEGSYKAFQRLPLALAQAANVFSRFRVVLNILLVAILFSDYRRWRWLIWGWVAFEIVNQLVSGGERSSTFFLLATVAIFYHLHVRRFRFTTAVVGAVAGLAVFQILGFLRQGSAAVLATPGFSVLGSAGEFEVLFSNAHDLMRRVAAGETQTSVALYFSDLLSVIPSQLLPFEKQDFSIWYLRSFYPAMLEAGAGFTFGVIPQGIIGFGAIEVIARGALIGLLFALAHRYYVRSSIGIWGIVTYVWLLINGYLTFRNSTFALVAPLLMGVLPAALIVWTLRALLRAGFRRRAAPEGAAIVVAHGQNTVLPRPS